MQSNDGGGQRKPGAQPERLTIDIPLDEALRRISQAKPPPGGIPDRPTRARRAKATRERRGGT
jgi:hypothetical protein